MRAHIIGNPVPTPEEMGKILGVSPERVAAVRQIMDESAKEKARKRLKTTVLSPLVRWPGTNSLGAAILIGRC